MAIFYVAILFILFLHNKIYLTDDSEKKRKIHWIYIQLSCSRLLVASSSGRNLNSLSVEVTIDWFGLINPTLIGCETEDPVDCNCCVFIGLPNGDVDDVADVVVVVILFLLLRPNVA